MPTNHPFPDASGLAHTVDLGAFVCLLCFNLLPAFKSWKTCHGLLFLASLLKCRTIDSFQQLFIVRLLCARLLLLCSRLLGASNEKTSQRRSVWFEAFVLNAYREPVYFRWHKDCKTIESDIRGSDWLVRTFGEVTFELRSSPRCLTWECLGEECSGQKKSTKVLRLEPIWPYLKQHCPLVLGYNSICRYKKLSLNVILDGFLETTT